MNLAQKVEKVHEEVIQQEGMKISELPMEIKQRIKGWNLLFARLEKNPEDEKLFRSLQRKSVEIADKIQNYIENDFDDEDDSNPPAPKKEEAKKPEKKAEEESSDDEGDDLEKNKAKEPKKEEVKKPSPTQNTNKVFGNLVMEKKIIAKIEESPSKTIRISHLREIIGKEPDYPEQRVNTIVLRKVFMSSDYRLR